MQRQVRDRDGRHGVALEVGELRLQGGGLEESREHVPGVQEEELHVDVGGRVLDLGEVAELVRRDASGRSAEVDADCPYLPRGELGGELLGRGGEEVVVEGDEDYVSALGEKLFGQGLADS